MPIPSPLVLQGCNPRDVTHFNLTSLPLQALEEALNVQASPPPIFAGTLEPAGKVPPQELLTQNELLKQQVGPEGWEGGQSRASYGTSPEGL